MKGLELLHVPSINDTVYYHPTLLYDDEHVILVDCGYLGTYDVLKQVLLEKGFTVSQLTHIIITHHDLDHIGNLHAIVKENPNVKVLASYIEEPYLTGEKEMIKISNPGFKEHFQNMLKNLPEDKKEKVKEAFDELTIEKVTVIHHNEFLPFCSGIKGIYTPGHTPGHLCLYLEGYKTLIAGDELNIVDGELVGPNEKFTQDMEEAIQSLAKFKKYDIQKVFCYHGGIYEKEPNARIVEIATSVL